MSASIVVNGKVVMAEETVKKIMLLNKLWIPDVLIDIIKDYLYVNTETVLRNYYKAKVNYSIGRLDVNYSNIFDQYGRIRLIHWAIGHDDWRIDDWRIDDWRDCVQLQDVICSVCGENESRHTNNDGCCAMEWDGVNEPLELVRESESDGSYYSEEEEEDGDW